MTAPASPRLIAIGLDSVDLRLLDEWFAAGELPNMKRCFDGGSHARLIGSAEPGKGHRGYTAETPITTLLTGCWPSTTGYWSPSKLKPSYEVEQIEAYDYGDFSHFYDYCRGRKIVVFDVPHARLSEKVDGVQVMAWGAHSPQGPSVSQPSGLLEEINDRYGPHPTLHKDDLLVPETDRRVRTLEERFIDGIERRKRIVLDMMREREWDLFVTFFGELHSAGHGFWHVSRPEHPLYAVYGDPNYDPLLNVYRAMDGALGDLLEAVPEDAYLIVFSQEGMKANSADLPSWFFLPELLHRHSFDGRGAFPSDGAGGPVPALEKYPDKDWLRLMWSKRSVADPIGRYLDTNLKFRLSHWYDRLAGLFTGDAPRLRHPLSVPSYMYMPQLWYSNLWPKMTAFALPSFSEGNVRINVEGREASGIVAPEDFSAVVDEIVEIVGELVNARTGEALVREVIRTRNGAFDRANGPDADIIFLWNLEPVDTADSPRYGRIGPGLYRRTGDHYEEGFFTVMGPGIETGRLPDGRLVDLAPTVLDLLGVPRPNHLDGQSLVPKLSVRAAE